MEKITESKKGILVGLIVLLAAIAGIVALTQADPEPIQNTAVDNNDAEETINLVDGSYDINNEDSRLTWNASKKLGVGPHDGSVQIESGNITVENGQVIGGNIAIDMTTIMTDDNGVGSEQLDEHLKSEDFFAVDEYETATLQATSFEFVSGNNYNVVADLTIRGNTNQITFPATIVTIDNMILVEAELPIDRTMYEVGTSSAIANIGIEDEFVLEVSLQGMISTDGDLMLDDVDVINE